MSKTFRISFLALLIATCWAAGDCGAGNDACTGFDCQTGFSCLIVDGNPGCAPDGDINGGGQNGPGEECDSNDDCQAGLSCQADLNGNLVCSE